MNQEPTNTGGQGGRGGDAQGAGSVGGQGGPGGTGRSETKNILNTPLVDVLISSAFVLLLLMVLYGIGAAVWRWWLLFGQ